jgi:signal transduction histidine kinase
MRPRWWLAMLAGGALSFTLLVRVTSVVDFAYRGPALHVAVETALQIFVMALFTASAVGLARRAERKPDPLTLQAAVIGERRRLARDIHDGMAQDLAFIVQQAEALVERDGATDGLADIATAARRALDESRLAIGALVRPADEPLDEALMRVAAQASGRWGLVAETHAAPGVELTVPKREALLRIVGEAVTNAARHGRSKHIVVELAEHPQLRVRISDNGVGFDQAAQAKRSGHYGITGMRERAELLGGQLRIASRPGEGTEIVVSLP